MNEQERQAKFIAGMKELERLYGVTIQAILDSEQLGTAILIKPAIRLALIAGWQPESIETPDTTK